MSFRKKHISSQQEQAADLPKKEYNNPGILRTLSTSQLNSGLPYQRSLNPEKVDKIVREWNPRKITPIVVSFGTFNIVDGQHHSEAARQRAGGRDVEVPCIIHTGLTYQEEAQMYADLDTDKTPLTPRQHTKALVEAGFDPKIMDIRQLVEDGGFTWALDVQTGVPYEIAPVRTLINAYQLLGSAGFSRMLALLAGAWQGTPHSLRSAMLSGMALFLKTYEPELDDQTFIACMSSVSPDEIIRRGRIDSSVALRHARIIWESYNSRQSGGLELPYRFKR
ncbi:MAG: hypothetical protein K2O18_00390 [Oscillospiraceae bacterium]|nr:hypothetical protein [Oscillospiraceae bacterium]